MNVLISTKPFIVCLEAVLVGVTVPLQRCPSLRRFPLGTSTKRAYFLKEYMTVFLKTPFRPCLLGCGRFLSTVNSHDSCLQCLCIQHAEVAIVDGLCVRSEHVTMAALRSCLSLLTGMGAAASFTTCPGFSATSRGPSASDLGDLRVTVRAFPQGQSPRTSNFSRSSCSVQLTSDSAVPSHGVPSVSFGTSIEDLMSSEVEDLAGLPHTGVAAPAESDPELTAMHSRAAASIGTPPSPEPLRRDNWFLGTGRGSRPRPAFVPAQEEHQAKALK